MTLRIIIIAAIICLISSGCSSSESINFETKFYKSNETEIEFKYPINWIVTDNSMGPGITWLVVSDKEYKEPEGSRWPFLNIYALKSDDKDFIRDFINIHLEKLSEYNNEIVFKNSNIKINGVDYIKYESEEIEGQGFEHGKIVNYIFNSASKTVVIETIEADTFLKEINTIIKSIDFNR
jgi:hypothetical protein